VRDRHDGRDAMMPPAILKGSLLMHHLRSWLLASSIVLIWSGIACAHALPTSETPAAGSTVATVATAPGRVSIVFGESIDPHFSGIIVENAQGERTDDGGSKPDPRNAKRLSVGLRQPVAPGVYTVIWHAFSSDGHRTQGSYRFSVGP
jgi:methionine-rich copper-binding protein CopC